MQKPRQNTVLSGGKVHFLPPGSIRPNPAQPRRIFDQTGLQELAASILRYGVLQPLTVRRRDGHYELVAGERRLRAAKLAGLREVPCLVVSVDEQQSGMLALVENLQRRDLDYLEEAEGLARLMRQYGLSQEQTAARVGKSQSAVANKLRLLRHSLPVREALRANHLTERHARALLRLESEQARLDAIAEIARQSLNVTRTEQLVDRLTAGQTPKRASRKSAPDDVRGLLSSVEREVARLRAAGLSPACASEESEAEIVVTIRIPKRVSDQNRQIDAARIVQNA